MLQTVLYCVKLHSMSEEYTQSKAYLDKLCRSGSKQESPYNPLMGLEPASVMIARLTAERDQAQEELRNWQDTAQNAMEERDEANAELDKAVCDLVDQNNELKAVRAELAKLQDRKPVRLPYHNADGTPFTLKRPVGYLQSLEARLAKLEGVVNAR